MTLLAPGPARTPTPAPAAASLRRPVPVRAAWVAAGLLALLLAAAASVALGVRTVGLDDLLGGLSGSTATIGEAAVAQRVPRTVLAMLVGAALALSGAVMQGLTRNPLADPGILGVTSGAALAVVVGIAFAGLADPASYAWVAIAGAAATALLVYVIGSMGRGGPTPLTLALSGAAVSAACTSLASAVLLPRVDLAERFRSWQVGGVGGADTSRTLQVLPFLLVGAVLTLFAARGLDSLALGDDLARGLGARVGRTRLLAATGAVVLAGAATAAAGPIGFVGLAVPHLCRLLVGPGHRWLLPASALGGAVLLTAADVLGRLVARPAELDVGIVTALLGAPVFIAIVRRQRVRAL